MASFSPLDLLTLSDTEQTVVLALTRQPQQTIAELAASVGLTNAALEILLRQMVRGGRVVEQLSAGERRFSVRFTQQRRKRNLPHSLLDLIEQQPDTLLASAAITGKLDDQARADLMARSTKRLLLPDEVYRWQGDLVAQVGLVALGLLKKTYLYGKQRAKTTSGYVRRAEWFGLGEGLSAAASNATYTAVTETELVLWTVPDFLDIAQRHPAMSAALTHFMSEQLQQCQRQQQQGMGVVWAIEALHHGAGATTLAVNLALLAAQAANVQAPGRRPRVVVWLLGDDDVGPLQTLQRGMAQAMASLPGHRRVVQHPNGFDLLLETKRSDYPPLVELDIVLARLQKQYDYVICDSGADAGDEFVLALRGRAETLVTLTRDAEGAAQALVRWSLLKPYAAPGQKRVLTLNGLPAGQAVHNPAFQLLLPEAGTELAAAAASGQALVACAPGSPLSVAYTEVFRRLSLTQTVAIFIPSTIDVDQVVENDSLVQATLTFLGNLFGGATSSDAEGVWRSEDSGLVVEKVSVVRSFVSETTLQRHLDAVIAFAGQIKEEMKQEAVAVDVNNELVLI